jgi:hypothetical protein
MKNLIKEILREGLITEITVNDAWAKFYSNVEKFPALKGDESLFNKLNDLYPRRGDNFNKGYFTWLYNLIRTNKLKEEDFYKAKEYLNLFDKFINRIPVELRDINKFKNLNDLYDVVQEFEGGEETMATSNKDEIRQIKQNEIDKVYEDNEWLIMIPKTERASCLIGKGTKWCTAAEESNNMFDSHNSQGPLYVMIDKYNDEKYQLHFETNQLMDATDRPVTASYFFDHVMENSGPFEFLKQANDKFWDFVLETSAEDMASGGYSETFEEALTSDVTPSVLKKTLETLRYGEDSYANYLGYVYEKNPYNIDKYEIEHFFDHIDTMDEQDFDGIIRHLNDIGYDFEETENENIKKFIDAKLELENHKIELHTNYEVDKGRTLRVDKININGGLPYNVSMDDKTGNVNLETLLNLLHHGQLFEGKNSIKNILRKNLIKENLQLADKVYFKAGKLSPRVREIILGITNGDPYTKIMTDIYYYKLMEGHMTKDLALKKANPENQETSQIENDILTNDEVNRLTPIYNQLKEYNKNIFPIKGFNINGVDDTPYLIRALEYRQKILNVFDKWPSIAKRNMKDDIRTERDSKEMNDYRNDLEYADSYISQLNNRNEEAKMIILQKIFTKNTTLEDILDFVQEKENLLGGTELTRKQIGQILKKDKEQYDELKVKYNKGNIMIIEVDGPYGIKEIGCNSVWCFTYNRGEGNMNWNDWYKNSTNSYCYVIIDFSESSDSEDFMHVLTKPLLYDYSDYGTDGSERLYTMGNRDVYDEEYGINDYIERFIDLPTAMKVMNFGVVPPKEKKKKQKFVDPNQLAMDLHENIKKILRENN